MNRVGKARANAMKRSALKRKTTQNTKKKIRKTCEIVPRWSLTSNERRTIEIEFLAITVPFLCIAHMPSSVRFLQTRIYIHCFILIFDRIVQRCHRNSRATHSFDLVSVTLSCRMRLLRTSHVLIFR